jgi:hypothetical protein
MPPPIDPGVNPYARQLALAVEPVIGPWVERSVRTLLAASGIEVTAELNERIGRAAAAASDAVGAELREFLEIDVDEQRTNPLAVLRAAVRFPTEVLQAAGVPEVRRDEFEERAFPTDRYRLGPATWSDVDPSLQEPGIIWGAWKAKTVLDRRRSEGKR